MHGYKITVDKSDPANPKHNYDSKTPEFVIPGLEDEFKAVKTAVAGGKTTAKGFGIDVGSALLGSLPATGVGIGTLLTQLETKKMVKDSGAAAVAQISRDVKNSKSKALLPLAIVTMLAAVGGFFATMGSKAAKRVV